MKTLKYLMLVGATSCFLGGDAVAAPITYNYLTTLTADSGGDALGLNGAVMNIIVTVDSESTYIERFGFPAVIMNNDATLTITGSSQAANNGTYALPQLAFYPSFAGLFTDPDGLNFSVALAVGGTLEIQPNTEATGTGAVALVGQTVQLSHFGPTVPGDFTWTGTDGTAYTLTDSIISASTSEVPEPTSISMILLGGAALGIARRRNRQAA